MKKTIFLKLYNTYTTDENRQKIITFLKYFFLTIYSILAYLYFEKSILLKLSFWDKSFFNIYFETTYFLSVLVILLIVIYKIYNRYIFTYTQFWFSFLAVFSITHSTLYINNYNLDLFKDSYLLNIYYLIYLLPIFIIITSSFVYRLIKTIFWNNKEVNFKNILLNDEPINNIKNENYKLIAEKLKKYILNDNHNNSFSIGILGQWGSGKSSLTNTLYILLNTPKNKEIECFRFFPYLNHRKDNIVDDFFELFSLKVAKHNPKLSNNILKYAQKLNKLYTDKNIVDFFNTDWFDKKKSLVSSIENINDSLKVIDKKFIVFIDDLDRLDTEEILQVLKLIRNTANFRNTFFIVSMDKDYVIDSIKKESINHKFIDKYFQLEINLPKAESSELVDFFKNELQNRINTSEINYSNLEFYLFEYYIDTYRDAKKIINQFIYEFSIYGQYINAKDILNFILLKFKFPYYISYIYNNFDIIFKQDLGIYNLSKIKDPKEEETFYSNIFHLDFFSIQNLKITKDLKISNKIKLPKLSNQEKVLFIRGVYTLFGEKNNNTEPDSIKYISNFELLFSQQVHLYFFNQKDFTNLIGCTNFEDILSTLEIFNNQNKIPQLINVISKIILSKEINKHEVYLHIALITHNKYINYEPQFDVVIKELLSSSYNNIDSAKLLDVLKIYLSPNDNLNIRRQFLVLELLRTSILAYDDFKISFNQTFKEVINVLFDKYLLDIPKHDFVLNDYSFYSVYHPIKKSLLIPKEEFNIKIIDFWEQTNISYFIAQLIDLEPFDKNYFQFSEIALEIFGSFENIRNNVKKSTLDIKIKQELLAFIELCEIVDRKIYLIYEFKYFDLFNEKIKISREEQNITKKLSITQVVLELSYTHMDYNLENPFILKKGPYNESYHYNNKTYFIVNSNSNLLDSSLKIKIDEIDKWLTTNLSIETKINFLEKEYSKGDKLITFNNGKDFINIFSINSISSN